MNNIYEVVRGDKLTIEWYIDENGKGQAKKYFNNLSHLRRRKLFSQLDKLAKEGELFNKEKFRSEGDKLFVIKAGIDRIFCFFTKDSKLILTNAYEKKKNKMPLREKKKALIAKKTYEKKDKEGTYYVNKK